MQTWQSSKGARVPLALAILLTAWMNAASQENRPAYPWHFGVSAGVIDFEGDEAVRDSFLTSLHVGRDVSERLTLEGVLSFVPELDEDFRWDWRTARRVSRLEEKAGLGEHETHSIRLALDGLYHLLPGQRLDPYVAAGAEAIWYADDFGDQWEPAVRAGAGVMYHLSGGWALRVDGRTMLAGADTEVNSTLTMGICWTPGGRRADWTGGAGAGTPAGVGRPPATTSVTSAVPQVVPPAVPPVQVPPDADRDGLKDAEETRLGTNPRKADTDGDGLTDAEEVQRYKTDPLNRDTDYDGLTDGDEIQKHRTDPLDRDTDDGGVADGHEVIEDDTAPLQKADDLQLFELRFQYDEGRWELKSEYFSELDAIGKILRADPKATARIEGHIDEKKEFTERQARTLTARRADAIEAYFRKNWKIEGRRLNAEGYGSSRPKAANRPEIGNPENRRIEIYIRRSDRKAEETPKAGTGTGAPADK